MPLMQQRTVAMLVVTAGLYMGGKTAAQEREIICPVCPDPYRSFSLDNLPLRDDSREYMWVRTANGARAVRNPTWKGRAGEADRDSEEPGRGFVTQSADRAGSAYHAAGYDVFRPEVLQNIGGVVSQGSELDGQHARALRMEVELGPDGDYPGYVLVRNGDAVGRYRIRYSELVPMALFVESGGTSLYTLWNEGELPAGFQQDAGFVPYEEGPGFVAIEFAGTEYADALFFLDTCSSCVAVPDDGLQGEINSHIALDLESGRGRTSSYINTDVGLSFELKMDSERAVVSGGIVRYHWSREGGTGGTVSIERAAPIVRPGELQANVDRFLQEAAQDKATEHLLTELLGRGIDVAGRLREEEAGIEAQRRLRDAFFLFETLVLLRAAKLEAPEEWSVLMAALSSDLLAARDSARWKQYTEAFCSVYRSSDECSK